jgi:Fe-S cluster biogenesis protein NfuA
MDSSADKKEKLKAALNEIRPFLQRDGGDIRVVEFTDNKLVIQFLGNCMHCSIKGMTLKTGIKYIINKYLPEIKEIKELEL